MLLGRIEPSHPVTYRDRYGTQSLNVRGLDASYVALVLIEKHFTLSRADGGVDSAFSLEPAEFRTLREETDRAWQALGDIRYGGTDAEKDSRAFRRSLYVVEEMKAGEPLTPRNMRAIRPGFGLPPKHYDLLMGKHINRDLAKGTPLSWDLIG